TDKKGLDKTHTIFPKSLIQSTQEKGHMPMKKAVESVQVQPALTELSASDSLALQTLAEDDSKLGGYAYQIIRQQSKKVFKLRSHVLADTDPENLHQMRIGTRRLRAALSIFGDVVDVDEAKLTKSITKVTKSLGKVRDIDVMKAWLKSNTSELDKPEKKIIKGLLKKLKKRRKKQFAIMETALESKSFKKLSKAFKKWVKQPAFAPTASQDAAGNAIAKLIGPLTALLRHPGWQVATHPQSGQLKPAKSITLKRLNQALEADGEQLHDLRKQIKRTRYQAEFFRSLYGITYSAQIREFRTLQTLLGSLQDQLVISDFLAAELGSDWAKQLPSIHQQFQTSRLELWQAWQPLQQKYLKLAAKLPSEKKSKQKVTEQKIA
ncbi:MAG: CHAD domain-containing protein, partial [Cyanobacteria bacterium J06631_9]